MGPRGWIALGPGLLLTGCGLLAAGCGGNTVTPGERTGSASEAIYGGVVDDDANANDAVVAIKIGNDAQSFELCTGALVAPNVVLTARHCVASNVAQSITCDTGGVSGSGDQVGADVPPSSLHVYFGAHANVRYGAPDANGTAVFHPATSVLCNTDIALILLDHAFSQVAPLRVRLAATTIAGESMRSVGFGQNDANAAVGTRLRKDGVAVKAIGAAISSSGTHLAAHEIELGMSTCLGDSGGPAISEQSGAVVGVVSRGGSCGDDFGHIYTMTSGFADLIGRALAAAGARPLDEVIGPETGDAGSPAGSPGSTTKADGGTNGATGERASIARTTTAAPACAARVAPGPAGPGPAGVEGVALVAIGLAWIARRRRKG